MHGFRRLDPGWMHPDSPVFSQVETLGWMFRFNVWFRPELAP
jgi:hypothetical protein